MTKQETTALTKHPLGLEAFYENRELRAALESCVQVMLIAKDEPWPDALGELAFGEAAPLLPDMNLEGLG
ncbi:MAG: hypothetical protein KOO60_07360 [Gemmatimonadales bacterium]|nr:hypothetical protein [Gemmatimonadales bacterium]